MEEGKNAFKMLTGRLTGKRPRCRWDDNIRMDPKEIGVSGMNWADSIQDRDFWRTLVALNLRVP